LCGGHGAAGESPYRAPRAATRRDGRENQGVQLMLYWALVFLVIALIAAALGFGGIASGAATIAKVLFIIFLVLFIVSLIVGLTRRGPVA
jgi:uncharacterized membrane protein YtjA (UPF0391 family)